MRKARLLLLFIFLFSALAYGQSKEQELYKAIVQKNEKQVFKLLQEGANANYAMGPENFRMHLLHTAITVSKSKTIVELLLKHKADVNGKDAFDSTPLMYAASSGDLEMVELLLQHGADVKAGDRQGNTVLTAAKESKNQAVIEFIERKLKEQN